MLCVSHRFKKTLKAIDLLKPAPQPVSQKNLKSYRLIKKKIL